MVTHNSSHLKIDVLDDFAGFGSFLVLFARFLKNGLED